jgi:1-acyl-sn-glycerol-3-phosphate acyltransferase
VTGWPGRWSWDLGSSVLTSAAHQVDQDGSGVTPPRWTLSPWAGLFRRLTHWWFVSRYVRRFCSPLEVGGMENLATLKGPAIFVANHTSHFDAYVVQHILPARWRNRAAMAAAADRWYMSKKLKVAWLSLNLNIYPIQRGGGRASLAHSEWLLTQGWSLIIFPEGTRAKKGYMEALKYGVAILALGQSVPVVPIHLRGVDEVLAPRTRALRRAPVWARIGEPIALAADQSLQEATAILQAAMRDQAQDQAVGTQEPTDRSPVGAIA